MEPTIPAGAEVCVSCGARPAVGEVGLLVLAGRPVVHRVVARGPAGSWVLTRGDATAVPDPPVAEADLVGRVVSVRRSERHEPTAAAPGSTARRVVLALAVAVLRRSPSAGRRFVGVLWLARRTFVILPRVAWRRAIGRNPGRGRPAGRASGSSVRDGGGTGDEW